MSSPAGQSEEKPPKVSKRPTLEFAAYCEAEFERRRNSGEAFDEATYREAMELVLGKLRRLEEEGLA